MEEKKEETTENTTPLEKIEDLFNKIVKKGHGPPSIFVMEWNRQTRQVFDRGNKPRAGNKYCFKCVRFDGIRAHFVIEHL